MDCRDLKLNRQAMRSVKQRLRSGKTAGGRESRHDE